MKAAGILDKLGDDVDEDIIVEMDSMSKRLMRKQRGISKEKEAANKAVAASLRLAGRITRVLHCTVFCCGAYCIALCCIVFCYIVNCTLFYCVVFYCFTLY